MRSVDEFRCPIPWSRAAIFTVIAVSAVSCSSESSRFQDNPFASKSSSADVTGSVSPRGKQASVQSAPLPPPQASAPSTRPAITATAGGGKGMASYQPGSASSEVSGSVPTAHPTPQQAASHSGWTWDGGTPVMISAGDTPQTLSQRYGVPASAIIQANNLQNGQRLNPGQRIVIPRYETTGSVPATRVASNMPPRPAPVIAAPSTSGPMVHTVAPGQTLMQVSRIYQKPLSAIAAANNIAPHTMVKVGDKLIIPGVSAPQTAASVAQAPAPVAQQQKPAPAQKVATAQPQQPVPTARAITPAADNPVAEKKTETTAALPTFRWPVRGRVITGFGPRPTGQANDGINVAVPEGTPIKAAEDGVVAYAGNELKTYGNLVLVRHSNGYVTAYAHASEITVKRDEPVKRGQVIGKAGQTGNVSAPQLHFEIRKGSSPVDPMPYLDKGGST